MVRAVRKRIGRRKYIRGAIQILDSGARIALLTRQKGRLAVSELIHVPFPKSPDGPGPTLSARAAAVRSALKSRGWQAGRMTLVLPKNVVTMRLVTLPSDEDAELAEMARFEAQKHIPFNVERHVISHAVLRKEGVEGSRTLIVAVDRAALEEPIGICREAGIELDAARVSSLAVVESLLLDPPEGWEQRTFAMVDIGWATVDITIVSDGIVRFTRSGTMGVERIAPVLEEMLGGEAALTNEQLRSLDALEPESFAQKRPTPRRRRRPTYVVDDFADEEPLEPVALQEGSPIALGQVKGESADPQRRQSGPAADVEKWLSRIVQEIERTYTFAAREFECPRLETVYLAGVGAYIYNIDEYLRGRLGCPVKRIKEPDALEFVTTTDRDLKGDWCEFAVAIGAAAGQSLPPMNLLPPEYTEQLEARRRRRSLTLTGLLVLLLLAISAAYAARWYADLQRQLAFYQKNNEVLEPKYEDLRDQEQRIGKMESILKDPLSALAVLEKISEIGLIKQNPPKVTLLGYQYEKGKGVTLSGHARTYADLVAFVDELKATGCFSDVIQKDRSPYKLSRGRPEVIQFTVLCDFKPDTSE